jgi:hypothetical protein
MRRAALLALLVLAGPALAQRAPLRDPMQPPAPRSAAPRASAQPPAEPAVRHLLVIGEQRWVIEDGRRHGVGDVLAGARIERIEDGAVIVRRAGALQRLPLYTGITRHPVPAPATAGSAPTGSTRIASSASAAGERSRRSTTP